MAGGKVLQVGDIVPPKQLLEMGHLYSRDNTTYCFKPSCDGCQFGEKCTREETTIKVGPGINIRQAFRARPGYKWVCIDFAGIELRVAAQLSGEPVWVKAFQDDVDLHCVAKGTRILTPDGYQKIEDLPREGGVVLSEFGPKKFKGVGFSGVKGVYRLITKTGATIKITKDHRFKIQMEDGSVGWKRLEDIRSGDIILSQRACGGMIPEDRGYDPEFWFAFGWLWGDGGYALSMSSKMPGKGYLYHRWYFADGGDDTARLRVKDYLRREGTTFRERLRPIQHKNCVVRMWEIIGVDKRVSEVIPQFEFRGEWRKEGFPDILWRQGKKQLRAFVDAMFSTDGTVHDVYRYEENRGGSRGCISFTTKWDNVAQDMRKLLSLMGMVSTVRRIEGGERDFGNGYGSYKTAGAYRVTLIGSRSWDIFVETIGFTNIKKDRLVHARTIVKNGGDRFLGIHRASSLVQGLVVKKVRPKWGVKSYKRGIAREVLHRIKVGRTNFIPDTRIPYMSELLESSNGRSLFTDYEENGWWFDVVDRVEYCGFEDTYDLFDSESNSFTADGFVTHNSAMAEVMFKINYDPSQHKVERDIAKMGNFGNLYLASIETFWKLTTLTYQEAAVAWMKWWAALPVYKAWIENQKKYYRQHGCVWTFFRRKREMARMIEMAKGTDKKGKKGSDNKKIGWGFCDRSSVNSPIQGTSADLLKMAMVRVDNFIHRERLEDDVKMMLTVHDELDFEIKDTPAQYEILREIGRQMTITPKGELLPQIKGWRVPLKVDIEIGDDWGNLTGIDDLDPATKDLPKPEKVLSPKKDSVTVVVSGITSEDANKLHLAIFQASNVKDVVKVPLMLKMGDRVYTSRALEKVSEGHLRKLVQGIPGVEVL